jgi:hypothetical protein
MPVFRWLVPCNNLHIQIVNLYHLRILIEYQVELQFFRIVNFSDPIIVQQVVLFFELLKMDLKFCVLLLLL